MIVVIDSLAMIKDRDSLSLATSFGTFILWASILYWFRISSKLSFYVKIVTYSVADIRYFLIMLSLMIAAFSNALVILDFRGKNDDEMTEEYKSFITEYGGNSLFDSFI